MNVTLHRLLPAEFSMYAPQLVDIYIEAMGYDPHVRRNRIAAWRSEVTQPGFTAILAQAESTVVGVAYGFLGSPDTWWDRQLRRGFEAHGGIDEARRDILTSYFELAEIHVSPVCQGHGIGKLLLHELLWNVPARHVLLSTPEVEGEGNRAFGLYRSEGFTDILRHYYYPGDTRPFAILGARLPLDSARKC
ncbi:GNAT family N-acetyltransferase [uncultured Corynebacterium sp.]|uniref:GNAT family N-acetyltransferase n=1 Tax=uncultured Corynebacterium sp. TaxID=159447 RepID=UPI0025F3B28B|nr:GNAT family N-acetyltransferase [uncultured Corynebacterium sp.]